MKSVVYLFAKTNVIKVTNIMVWYKIAKICFHLTWNDPMNTADRLQRTSALNDVELLINNTSEVVP